MKPIHSALAKTCAVLAAFSFVALAPRVFAGGGTASSFSGQATVLRASVLGLNPIVVSDTGPLPSSGGALQTSLLSENIPGLGSVEVCHAATVGQGDQSFADASVGRANLAVTPPALLGTTTVSADAVSSWAMANCCTGPMISGASSIANLVLNGTPITVTGQPNQTVDFGVGRLIINEQITSLGTNSGSITVNALHLIVNGAADVVVSSSHADITCAAPGSAPPPGSTCGDFVTGGGWITGTPSGAKANFGVAGGIQNGAFWGHLNYIDHGSGMHVKDTAVTGYAADPSDPDCRIITYNVDIDGSPGTATVRACDKGEPGANDIFEITLSNGYHAAGDLGGSRPGGGNIQLHKCQ